MDHDAKSSNAGAPYDVGHCKPPSATRWKPGQSGNPAGKKPGTRSLKSVFLKLAMETPRMDFRTLDDPTHATNIESAMAALIERANRGDLRALTAMFELCDAFLPDEEADADAVDDEADTNSAPPRGR